MASKATTEFERGGRALRFGLSPALSSEVAYRVGADVCRVLGARLGRAVQPLVYSDYGKLEAALLQGRVDFAWMPPVSFLEVATEGCGLLVLMERAGRSTFESALVVRAGDGIAGMADLRQRRAAWVDPRSASGYLVALSALLEELGQDEALFAQERFCGSHRAACEAVLDDRADFCATYSARDGGGAVVEGGWLKLPRAPEGALVPLEFFGPIPADAIAHAPGLSEADALQLREVLASLHSEEAGRQLIGEVFSASRLVRGDAELLEDLAWAGIVVGRYREKHPLPQGAAVPAEG